MPLIRDYPEATQLEDTDAFVIDRLGVGTMFVEADVLTSVGGSRCLTYIVDGGGSELTSGIVGDLYVPFNYTITSATLLADQTGSIVVDIWSDALGSYPPTNADSITASAPPTITADDHSQDNTLTGWTTTVAGDTTLRFNIDSVTDITRLTIALAVTATGG